MMLRCARQRGSHVIQYQTRLVPSPRNPLALTTPPAAIDPAISPNARLHRSLIRLSLSLNIPAAVMRPRRVSQTRLGGAHASPVRVGVLPGRVRVRGPEIAKRKEVEPRCGHHTRQVRRRWTWPCACACAPFHSCVAGQAGQAGHRTVGRARPFGPPLPFVVVFWRGALDGRKNGRSILDVNVV